MNTPVTKESEGSVSADEPPLLREDQLRSAIQWVNMVDPPRELLNGHALGYYSLRAKDLINPAGSGDYASSLSDDEVRLALEEALMKPAVQLERPLKFGIDFTNRLPQLARMQSIRGEVLSRIVMSVNGQEQFAGPGKFYHVFEADPELAHKWYCISLRHAADIAKRCTDHYPQKKVHMAVNVGPHSLSREDFVQSTLAILAEADVKPGTVGLELLEKMPTATVDEHIGKLHELKDRVPISNDDSPEDHSVTTAKLLCSQGVPIDRVKISGGYVKRMAAGSVSPEQYKEHLAWALSCRPKGIVFEGYPGVDVAVVRGLQNVVCQMKKLLPKRSAVFEYEGCAAQEMLGPSA